MEKKFELADFKKAQKNMIACPFCGSNKVKVTSVSKGSNKGNRVQGMCNVCYGRGPAVADDPYKAVELWNKRLLYDSFEKDSIELDSEQLERFFNGEILLNTRTQLEYNSVIYCFESRVKGFKSEEYKYIWNKYGEDTVVDARSSEYNRSKILFGNCNTDWFSENDRRPIEQLKIVNKKTKK